MIDYLVSMLRALPAEAAHDAALYLLRNTPTFLLPRYVNEQQSVTLAGVTFPNRIGLAAGFDKQAACVDALLHLGFGFVEVGTVTPEPQPGNSKPRMFRLPEHKGIINRFGFNSVGLDRFIQNLQGQRCNGVVGINLGKNKATLLDHAVDDYLIGLSRAYEHADYVTINISSPNTPGLRDLHNENYLQHLLSQLVAKQQQLAQIHNKHVPLFVKVSPDLKENEIKTTAQLLLDTGIHGLIATNTTIDREQINNSQHAQEQGGLSGAPLTNKALDSLQVFKCVLGDAMPIISVGGVMSADHAEARFKAGADLVQLYTGLVFKGMSLLGDCLSLSPHAVHAP